MPRAFVIGDPIAHSRSPLVHGTWLQTYGIKGAYVPIHVTPDQLRDFAQGLRAGKLPAETFETGGFVEGGLVGDPFVGGPFVGGNVTLPHKQAIIPFCTSLDDAARRIGAVNTLVVEEGEMIGSNTDWIGFSRNLDVGAPGWDTPKGQRALVLGAGGAARAIIFALIERGFGQIVILNRTADKARALATEFAQWAKDTVITGGGLDEFEQNAPMTALLVNTSAVGMHNTGFEGLDFSLLPKTAIVTDIVYTPLITPFLKAASDEGLTSVDGLGMLLHQAVPGFAAWFGITPEVTPQLRALLQKSLFGAAMDEGK